MAHHGKDNCGHADSRGVTRGARGHYFRGAESLWGRRITSGDAERLRGAPKSPNNVTSIQYIWFWKTFNTVHLLPKDLTFEHGRQTCFLPQAPSNLVAPLAHSWKNCDSSNKRFLNCEGNHSDANTARLFYKKKLEILKLKPYLVTNAEACRKHCTSGTFNLVSAVIEEQQIIFILWVLRMYKASHLLINMY